jgi:G3E family GTPase
MTLPVTVLTGFLGSGKTTLLNRLLQRPALADTAVVINEIGAIGIDHLLVERVDENLRLLQSGCLCCTVRGDLVDTLADLATRRAAGQSAFSRVIVETTGLADPAPVLHTLMADPALAGRFRLDGVATTVDAFNGDATLERHAQARRQVAVADLLLLTKTDLVEPAATERLATRLAGSNPGARCVTVRDGDLDPADLFGLDDPGRGLRVHGTHGHPHDPRIRAHAFTFDAPLPRAAFLHWLELMAALRGERLLRVKGLVQLAEHPDTPLVVHGVQHVFHPPRTLGAWPDGDRRTRLVFVVQDLERAEIERTFCKFVQEIPA